MGFVPHLAMLRNYSYSWLCNSENFSGLGCWAKGGVFGAEVEIKAQPHASKHCTQNDKSQRQRQYWKQHDQTINLHIM